MRESENFYICEHRVRNDVISLQRKTKKRDNFKTMELVIVKSETLVSYLANEGNRLSVIENPRKNGPFFFQTGKGTYGVISSKLDISKIDFSKPCAYRICHCAKASEPDGATVPVLCNAIITSNQVNVENRNGKYGVYDSNGNVIVALGKYEWISNFWKGLARVYILEKVNEIKDFGYNNVIHFDGNEGYLCQKRWGIINYKGEEVVPPTYDSVWNFYNKDFDSIILEKNGVKYEVYFDNPTVVLPYRHIQKKDYYDDYEDENTNYAEDTWYALTDGMYGDYPDGDVDYDGLGF